MSVCSVCMHVRRCLRSRGLGTVLMSRSRSRPGDVVDIVDIIDTIDTIDTSEVPQTQHCCQHAPPLVIWRCADCGHICSKE